MRQNQPKTAAPLQAPDTWTNPQAVLGLVLDHTRDAIVVQDIEGRIEWINPAAEAMFRWSLDEAVG